MSTYNYSIASDTKNAVINPSDLMSEISQSSIAKSLEQLFTDEDVITIKFGAALSTSEETALDAVMGAHEGNPTDETIIPQEVHIVDTSTETGGIKVTNKFAPDGWLQRLHEIEFTTSTEGGAIHDKDHTNADTGWSGVEFYEDISGVETLMVSPTQSDLDSKCIRTDFKWMPDTDYMILSGVVSQIDIPTDDVYFWGMFLDVDPALNVYGVFPVEVLGGGMNMKYIASRDRVGLKGVSGSKVYYAGVDAPTGFAALPEGMGTNRIRYIFRHSAGLKHRIQSIFEIFRA